MRDEMRHARDAARKRAAGRNKVRTVAMKRKEEYLGARVPKELRSRVVDRAEELGVPVSMLIRDVLMAAFGEPCAGMTSGPQTAFSVANAIAPEFASVLGWEAMRLNRPVQCSRCGIALSAGSSVTVGVYDSGGPHVVLCQSCKEVV